ARITGSLRRPTPSTIARIQAQLNRRARKRKGLVYARGFQLRTQRLKEVLSGSAPGQGPIAIVLGLADIQGALVDGAAGDGAEDALVRRPTQGLDIVEIGDAARG